MDKPYWNTTVCEVQPDTVFLRGFDINGLIRRLPFSATCFLVVRGRMPTPSEARVMDALLNSTLDYGLFKPGTVAARFVVSANPNMVAGLAASVLACGEHTLAPENAGRFILDSYARYKASGKPMDEFAEEFVVEMRATKVRAPGFGHPNFEYVDPRSQTLRDIAVQEGVWGEIGDWYEAVHRAFIVAVNKPKMPINDIGMVAAIMTQMGFEPAEMNGISLMSAFPGVIAHITEELKSKRPIRVVPADLVSYPTEHKPLNPALTEAGWDDAGYGKN
jgi:citryl-CoA lyase